MSGYGMFEAAETDGFEEQNHRREAQKKLAGAMYAARQQFGDFLGGAKDRSDFDVRLALVKKELMACVEANGVMPVTGVMNKVVKSMKPDFRAREAARKKALKKTADDTLLAPPGMVDYNQQVRPMGEPSVVDRGWGGGADLDNMSLEELMEWDRRNEWHAKRKTAADWSKVDYGFDAENETWKAQQNGLHLVVQKWLDSKPSWGVENSSGMSLKGGYGDDIDDAKRKAEEAASSVPGYAASKKTAAEEGSCETCGGNGRVADEDGGTKTCPSCNGYGTSDGSDPFAKRDSRRRTAAPEGEYHPKNDWPGYLDSTSPQSEPAADQHTIKTEDGLEHEDADNHRNFTTSKNLMAEMKEAFGEKSASSDDLYAQMRSAFGEG